MCTAATGQTAWHVTTWCHTLQASFSRPTEPSDSNKAKALRHYGGARSRLKQDDGRKLRKERRDFKSAEQPLLEENSQTTTAKALRLCGNKGRLGRGSRTTGPSGHSSNPRTFETRGDSGNGAKLHRHHACRASSRRLAASGISSFPLPD